VASATPGTRREVPRLDFDGHIANGLPMSVPVKDVTAHSSPRPSGTVTFLFTDIEGSTARWDRGSDAMHAALRRHDVLMRTAIAKHGGHIFKTLGDAFCAVFTRADNAVDAALDAQRALVGEDFSSVDGLRVRMAIHTGTADERDDDYFGPVVNRVSRLLAIGHGGQVLVSGVSADLVRPHMASQAMHDLGQHRLKDLASPERVFQLVARDLRREFPPLRSLERTRNNLPLQLTSFVGREADVAEIEALLDRSRLLTVCGAGGVGKTRAALHVGADVTDRFADGVWFVELAPIIESSLVAGAVAQALGVQESPSRSLLETVLAYLGTKRFLLVLDNCEHVIGEAASVAGAILRSCPNAALLATSREALGISGEHRYRLTSLAVPPAESIGALTSEAALGYGAIALFAERAGAVDNRFSVTDRNAPIVADICKRLDGIPLAIELAAARVRVLSVKVVSEKLNERFGLLTGGSRTALPRQQTMRALIDWSYDLLAEPERELFRRLSIFAGGFTLELVSAVCVDASTGEGDAVELLASLVDKSLVQVEALDDTTRYGLLESTRQYAREKLVAAGEYDRLSLLHASAFLALAEELDAHWSVTADQDFLAQAEPELDNWRAALGWALGTRHATATGQQLAAALRRVWSYVAAPEGRRWVRAAAEAVDESTPLKIVARIELAEAHLAVIVAQFPACKVAAERAAAAYDALGDQLRAAEARRYLAVSLVALGSREDAEGHLRDAVGVFRALGAQRLVGLALQDCGNARMEVGDSVAARTLYAEALSIYKATGAQRALATIATNLAETEFVSGNVREAVALARDALAAARALDFRRVIVSVLCNAAAYCVALGDWDDARTLGREALTRALDARLDVYAAFAIQHLAAVAAGRAEADREREPADRLRAAQLLGFVDARLSGLEGKREFTEQQEYREARATLASERLADAMSEGAMLTEDQAVAEAMQI